MAIGGVIANRSFDYPHASGRLYQTGSKGDYLGFFFGRYGHVRVAPNGFHHITRNCSTIKCSYRSFLCGVGTKDWRTLENSSSICRPSREKLGYFNSSCGRCRCSLPPHTKHRGSCLVPSGHHKFLLDDEKLLRIKHVKYKRARTYYKSEEYDITDPRLESLRPPEVKGEVVLPDRNVQETTPWWKQIPKRWVIVLLCFASFLLCNMDRVNMSIAVLPMSQEFNWNSATVGLIQSSFFWGYLLTQIIGGIWADKIGGKTVLGFGVVWWSIATMLTPIAAKIGLPFLLVVRAFMGIGEGVAMPAMNNMVSKWIPVSERSRALALVYSGMYLGSVAGLGFSPVLIQKFGWPSVFYSFGSLGSIWFALWLSNAYSSPDQDPKLTSQEKRIILKGSISKEPVTDIPWKLILSKAPVWALIISHFCHNWGTFILLTWMPTYYNQVLNFNLMESGLFCVLPWLTMALSANIGGWIADTLVSKGFSVTSVRKVWLVCLIWPTKKGALLDG